MRKLDQTITKTKLKIAQKIMQSIMDNIYSMIYDYEFLYSDEELKYLCSLLYEMKYSINQDTKGVIKGVINYFFEVETHLKPYAIRTWQYELENNDKYLIVSWLKKEKLGKKPNVISATLIDKYNYKAFCNANCGIVYDVNELNFIGGTNDDAATIINKQCDESIYSIAKLDDDTIVNSYNCAVSIITPKLIMQKNSNGRLYNEIILNGKYSFPKAVIVSNGDEEVANYISTRLGVPVLDINMHEIVN